MNQSNKILFLLYTYFIFLTHTTDIYTIDLDEIVPIEKNEVQLPENKYAINNFDVSEKENLDDVEIGNQISSDSITISLSNTPQNVGRINGEGNNDILLPMNAPQNISRISNQNILNLQEKEEKIRPVRSLGILRKKVKCHLNNHQSLLLCVSMIPLHFNAFILFMVVGILSKERSFIGYSFGVLGSLFILMYLSVHFSKLEPDEKAIWKNAFIPKKWLNKE